MAAAFGMEVEAYDPFAPAGAAFAPAQRVAALGEALGRADYVSIHAPKGDAPLLGPAEIAAMKPGAVLVNTARGGVADEAALVAALAAGRISAAGLDVFAAEPPAPDDPLLRAEGAILSPHIAGLTVEAAERMSVASVRNALDFFAGRLDPELVVNRAALAGAAP
jgi:D-3-phosphoglycerate dehydrogenase